MIREQHISLQRYGVDPLRGFLPVDDPLAQLPPAYAPWDRLAAEVPARLLAGNLRATVEAMPEFDVAGLTGHGELERAMLILSVVGNAYVWAGPDPVAALPSAVARPWWAVAHMLGRPPIIAHASIVLNNWRRLDPDGPLSLDNLDTLCTFLDGGDERWFYLVTVAIEAAGGPAVAALVDAQTAAASGDSAAVMDRLAIIEGCLEEMFAALNRMPQHCDPYIFYHRVRPYLSSWLGEGLVYLGVDAAPHKYSGGSAAQSSLIQALDAGLGISHASPFLADMRNYMPPEHRRFIEVVEEGPSLRAFVEAQAAESPALTEQFNLCVGLLDDFRKAHLELSVRYIKQQAPPGETAMGTGGTDFVPLLSEARKETRAGKL